MQKTKLGVSVGLLGAAIYFSGLVNMLLLFLLAGYVLLFEENEWLRRAAVKAAAIVIGFALVSVLIGTLDNVFAFFNVLIGWMGTSFKLGYPLGIDTLLRNLCSFAENVILLLLGYSALSLGSIRIDFFDKIVNKHFTDRRE